MDPQDPDVTCKCRNQFQHIHSDCKGDFETTEVPEEADEAIQNPDKVSEEPSNREKNYERIPGLLLTGEFKDWWKDGYLVRVFPELCDALIGEYPGFLEYIARYEVAYRKATESLPKGSESYRMPGEAHLIYHLLGKLIHQRKYSEWFGKAITDEASAIMETVKTSLEELIVGAAASGLTDEPPPAPLGEEEEAEAFSLAGLMSRTNLQNYAVQDREGVIRNDETDDGASSHTLGRSDSDLGAEEFPGDREMVSTSPSQIGPRNGTDSDANSVTATVGSGDEEAGTELRKDSDFIEAETPKVPDTNETNGLNREAQSTIVAEARTPPDVDMADSPSTLIRDGSLDALSPAT